jgi:hypothetical protein
VLVNQVLLADLECLSATSQEGIAPLGSRSFHRKSVSNEIVLRDNPLCRDVQQRLREAQPPCFSEAEADWA